MPKELIFMGRSRGKVRLALFDSENGIARKLPVKEITEDMFVAGIKSGNLPVRGFGVNKGRVTCTYGNWYTLPHVENYGGLSLFGTVGFKDENQKIEEDTFDGHCFVEAEAINWYGIASIDWNDGMFRVISPSTLMLFNWFDKKTIYSYDGPMKRIRLKSTEETTPDYTYPECDSSETLDDVANWLSVPQGNPYIFIQWVYQRCESIGTGKRYKSDIEDFMLKKGDLFYRSLHLILMGTRAVDVLTIPESVTKMAIRKDRQIGLFDVVGENSLELYNCDDITVKCPKLNRLEFSTGTYAKLIRNNSGTPLRVENWEGWQDSNGDYRGLNIKTLVSCFQNQIQSKRLMFDIEYANNSFNNINADVVFENELANLNNCFYKFKGSLAWKGSHSIYACFKECNFTAPLDLRSTLHIDGSVNDVAGSILLPDAFTWLYRKVFNNTCITSVKLTPIVQRGHITICNNNLNVDIIDENAAEYTGFGLMEVAGFTYSTTHKYTPKFEETLAFPGNIVTGVSEFVSPTFQYMKLKTLDLNKFPDTMQLPECVAQKCAFSIVIINDNIKSIASRAFVECGSIRWVYIPSSVEEIGSSFIQRPRIPYTIFTQKGSAADKYAKKYNIEVHYVDNLDQFKSEVQEIPEELEGTVAVAALMGSNDGEASAVMLACQVTDFSAGLYEKYPILQVCSIPLSEIGWVDVVKYNKALSASAFKSARLQIVLSYLSNVSKCHLPIKDIKERQCKGQEWFNCGDYIVGYTELNTACKTSDYMWVIVKKDEVVHMFTEKVSSNSSGGAVYRALNCARNADVDMLCPTNIASVFSHTNFTGRGIDVHGTHVGKKASETADKAIKATLVPLGVFQSKTNSRSFIGIDVTTLDMWGFKLSSGKSLDIRESRNEKNNVWDDVLGATGSVSKVEDISQWQRIYSNLNGSDKVVDTLIGVETIKNNVYDTSLPEKEIEAIRIINKVYREQRTDIKTVTLNDFKDALLMSGFARAVKPVAWLKIKEDIQGGWRICEGTLYLKDGTCAVKGLNEVSWFEFGNTAVVAALEYDNIFTSTRDILSLYENLPDIKPNDRENHFAHTDCMLPHSEFYQLREFKSGGSYSKIGEFNPYAVVSKISGKPCVAVLCRKGVIPIFWTNTIAAAFRVFEICGLMGFTHKDTWKYNSYYSLCEKIFSSEEKYNANTPDFEKYYSLWKDTRDALKRGETDGYLCVTGIQDIFDLAVKHPPVL